MKTEDLIRTLSADASPRENMPLRLIAFGALGSYLVLVLIVIVGFGIRADFATAVASPRVQFKFAFGLALIASSLSALIPLMRPETTPSQALRALIPAGCVAIIGAAGELMTTDAASWGTRLLGNNAIFCLLIVPGLSLIPLAVLLYAGRSAASSFNGTLGFVAGLLSGGLAATAYALHCPDDSPLFVITWYGIAIALIGLVGARLGRRLLKW